MDLEGPDPAQLDEPLTGSGDGAAGEREGLGEPGALHPTVDRDAALALLPEDRAQEEPQDVQGLGAAEPAGKGTQETPRCGHHALQARESCQEGLELLLAPLPNREGVG